MRSPTRLRRARPTPDPAVGAAAALLVLTAAAASCASPPAPPPEPGDAPDGAPGGAPEAFHDLETLLTSRTPVRIDFVVRSEGAVETALDGFLALGPSGRARIEARGHFGGEESDLLLDSDGGVLRLATATDTTTGPVPEKLREALAVGFTRMGILHNLARLTAAGTPDHAEGGVTEWVRAERLTPVEAGEGARRAVALDVVVGGRASGSAELHLDGDGLPVVRFQTVRFPAGTMEVVERYTGVRVGPGAVEGIDFGRGG